MTYAHIRTSFATGRVGWTASPTPHPILLPVAMSVRPAIDIHSNMPIRRKYFRGARKIASSWAPQQTVVNVELASGSSAYQTGTFTIVNPIDEEGTRTIS